MHRTTLIRQIVLGLVLGSILLGPTRVRAQWAVYDHPNWVLKFKEMVEDANRWVTTVNNYAEMYTKAAQQLMALGGILDRVEKTLARNKDLITTWSNVGKSVRGVLRLRRQLENMVRCRIQSIQSIADRLRNGVFDMEANARDLENYLKHTIGKASEEAIANIERLANQDATLDRLRYDLHVVEARIAEQQEALKQYEALIEAWEVKPDDERYGYSDINTHIEICKQTIAALEKAAERDHRGAGKAGQTLRRRPRRARELRQAGEGVQRLARRAHRGEAGDHRRHQRGVRARQHLRGRGHP